MPETSTNEEWWRQFGPDSPLNWNFDLVPDSEIGRLLSVGVCP